MWDEIQDMPGEIFDLDIDDREMMLDMGDIEKTILCLTDMNYAEILKVWNSETPDDFAIFSELYYEMFGGRVIFPTTSSTTSSFFPTIDAVSDHRHFIDCSLDDSDWTSKVNLKPKKCFPILTSVVCGKQTVKKT